MSLSKKLLYFSVLLAMGMSLFIGCKKFATNEQADLITTATSASVSGFVTDENNSPVEGASVKIGSKTTNTDQFGYFEIKNAEVVKNAAFVTISKNGYFKGIKTFIAADGKSAFFRIKLIPKKVSGTVNAAAGGTVTLSNGLAVTLPANAVVNAATNAAYSGTVNVSAFYIDPTTVDGIKNMPGDLRGIDAGGGLKGLTSYGMSAIELTGGAGELLQIGAGKKAILTMPIPASIAASAPGNIPLWYFDETNGLWKEEGSATKTGNSYQGEVAHFSFWNCDAPFPTVPFECTFTDASGNPLAGFLVKISVVGNPIGGRLAFTDANGHVQGAIPANATLLLELSSGANCVLYSQQFSSGNSPVSLGTIIVGNGPYMAVVSGTATTCSNTPLSGGSVISLCENQYTMHPVNSNGTFSFALSFCNPSGTNISLKAFDINQLQQGNPATFTILPGNNTVGNLAACGNTTDAYIHFTINGVYSAFDAPADTILHDFYITSSPPVTGGFSSSFDRITGKNNSNGHPVITFDHQNIGLGSSQKLLNFYSYSVFGGLGNYNNIQVFISEYGAVGQYISGSFSGILYNPPLGPIGTANVTCNFRAKRTY